MRNSHTHSQQSVKNGFPGSKLNLPPVPIDCSHDLAIENVSPGRFCNRSNLSDQFRGNIQFSQALPKQFNNSIEMRIIEAALHQMGVPTAHVLARVMHRPTKGHGKKGFLPGDLMIHINAFKEVADSVIRENLAIEDIHCGFDGSLAAQLFVECAHKVTMHLICIVYGRQSRKLY